MRPLRLVIVAPLALLAACTGTPNNNYTPLVTRDGGRAAPQMAMGSSGLTPDSSGLRGMKPLEIKSMFGKPGFTRRDAPAEIWSYRGRGCTLDVFLYDEGNNQTVAHYAVRSSQSVSEADCLNELASQPKNVPAG